MCHRLSFGLPTDGAMTEAAGCGANDKRAKLVRSDSADLSFEWLKALEKVQNSEVGVLIFKELSFSELRNAALTCKLFKSFMQNDTFLAWRFHWRGAPRVGELLNLEGRTLRAGKLTSVLLERRRDLFVKIRKILFDWLVDVQREYRLTTQTLHMAFNLIDRYFEKQWDIPTARIQLLGATCLWIAAKFHEIHHPSIAEMVWICDDACTEDQFRIMEIYVLQHLEWKLRLVTPFEFVSALCSLLDLPPAIKSTASYLVDLFMLEYDSIGVSPSAIAGASVIFSFRCTDMTKTVGVKDIPYLTQTPAGEIREIICKMLWFYNVDYYTNNEFGKVNDEVVRPLTDWRGKAVNRLHSGLVVGEFVSDSSSMPAAQVAPPRMKVLSNGSCFWCRKYACGKKLQEAFPNHVDRV